MLTMKASTTLVLALLIALPTLSLAQLAPTKDGDTELSIESGGRTRHYLLHLPAGHDAKTPLPLVLLFHATGGTAKGVMNTTGFSKVADQEKFIIAAPQGTYLFTGRNSWNADLDPTGVNDIEFVRDLIREIDAKISIDKKRVYAAGYSGGARISSRLACEMSDVIAGIGAVAGLQFPMNCTTNRPVAIIAFHGTADGIGEVEPSVARWVQHNGCNQAPATTKVSEDVTRHDYGGCKGNAAVVFYRINRGGHVWPGSPVGDRLERLGLGHVTRDINATDLIWGLLKRRSLP